MTRRWRFRLGRAVDTGAGLAADTAALTVSVRFRG